MQSNTLKTINREDKHEKREHKCSLLINRDELTTEACSSVIAVNGIVIALCHAVIGTA